MAQMTLVATARSMAVPALPEGLVLREPELADAEELGRLYFESYAPGVACASLAEAIEEIRAAFKGDFGDLWTEASAVVESQGELVTATLVVHRAPWPDTPDCPFVTDLFTAPRWRRQGLARTLLARSLTRASMIDRPRLALRVESTNKPAVALYQALGFHATD
ncbi:GNAT family N-acetyltransferase [Nonomuraea africana]|uniref:GNAT superfamily N-acetyltransferase n=1 Tax=Nonomuraea africana TaxID=46171 RepID=A0ABR9KQB0_9ACTN|nr:GNAT family N-acetyltransferase [Nonomuraea africana]MBE1564211.1 GNAT superfamily N-acetyltransferase [Nonomuraea africana]